MKQYCRYCTQCTVQLGDEWIYCEKKSEFYKAASAKRPNKCKDFDFIDFDAFGYNDSGYKPRKKKMKDCAGQLSLDFTDTDGSEKGENA